MAPVLSLWKWQAIYTEQFIVSSEENSYDEEEEYYSGAQYEADRRDEQIDLRWDSLGKYETIVYDDERFDDGGYEFSWDEPDDND